MRYRQRGHAAVVSDDRYELFVRQWLNDPRDGGTGFVHAEITRRPDYPETDFQLELADCQRKISLWFEISGRQNRLNSLAKLDILIEAATRFREEIFRKAVDEVHQERKKRREKAAEKLASSSSEPAQSSPAPPAPDATTAPAAPVPG